METAMIKRKQKVYYIHYDNPGSAGKLYPMIRLAGKYLRRFNFNVGDRLTVYVSEDQIVIMKALPDLLPAKETQSQ